MMSTLRTRREERGLTIPQLAHMAGVRERAIIHAEEHLPEGTDSPSTDRVHQVLLELEAEGWTAPKGTSEHTRFGRHA